MASVAAEAAEARMRANAMGVTELRASLASMGVDSRGALEKSDLVALFARAATAEAATARAAAPDSNEATAPGARGAATRSGGSGGVKSRTKPAPRRPPAGDGGAGGGGAVSAFFASLPKEVNWTNALWVLFAATFVFRRSVGRGHPSDPGYGGYGGSGGGDDAVAPFSPSFPAGAAAEALEARKLAHSLSGGVLNVPTHGEFEALLRRHAEDTGLPVVVDFTSQGCGPCRMIAPYYGALAKEMQGEAVFLKVDMDVNFVTGRALGVRGMPTFAFFLNDGGKEKRRLRFSGADGRRLEATAKQLAAEARRQGGGGKGGGEEGGDELAPFLNQHAPAAALAAFLRDHHPVAPLSREDAAEQGAGEEESEEEKEGGGSVLEARAARLTEKYRGKTALLVRELRRLSGGHAPALAPRPAAPDAAASPPGGSTAPGAQPPPPFGGAGGGGGSGGGGSSGGGTAGAAASEGAALALAGVPTDALLAEVTRRRIAAQVDGLAARGEAGTTGGGTSTRRRLAGSAAGGGLAATEEEEEEEEEEEMVVVVGGGPAGLSAALYAARAGLRPLVVAPSAGGQLLSKGVEVENYPGVVGFDATGPGLIALMREQAQAFGVRMWSEAVAELLLPAASASAAFTLVLNDTARSRVRAKAVVVATGAASKWLGVPGESALRGGGGVSACATCDGFLYRDQPVVVVGGGDTAMEDALVLARTASQVTLVHRNGRFDKASHALSSRVLAHPKIKVLWHATVAAFLGDDDTDTGNDVTGAGGGGGDGGGGGGGGGLWGVQVVQHANAGASPAATTVVVKCRGAFVAIGHDPVTAFLRGKVSMDDGGYLLTGASLGTGSSSSTMTSVEGIFAAGDVSDPTYRQAVTSAGSGAMAALDAERWLSAKGGRQTALALRQGR